MGSNDQQSDRLLQTARGSALLRWDTLLEVQVDIFLAYELQYLIGCDAWHAARRVADAGCGNGFFLSSLSRYFPDKSYQGIDISPELVAVAKANHERRGLEFGVADFFTWSADPPVDFLLMRLIVQHLRGLPDVLARARELVAPGGSLLIVEPDPPRFLTYPPTPHFQAMLVAVKTHGAQQDKSRGDVSAIADAARSAPGWRLADDRTIVVSKTGPFAGSSLLEMYLLWIESLESAGEIEFPYEQARKEIEKWGQQQTTYTQIGIRFFRLERDRNTRA